MEQPIDEFSLKNITRRAKVTTVILAFGLGVALTCVYGSLFYELGLGYSLILCLVCIVTLTLLHEGLHGLFFKIFSDKVTFGAKAWTKLGPVFWASSPVRLSRSKFQVVALAPQILTVALVLIVILCNVAETLEVTLAIIAMGNLLGGIFDIYTAWYVRRFPEDYLILDTKDGVRVYSP